jgi:hypothetical protein
LRVACEDAPWYYKEVLYTGREDGNGTGLGNGDGAGNGDGFVNGCSYPDQYLAGGDCGNNGYSSGCSYGFGDYTERNFINLGGLDMEEVTGWWLVRDESGFNFAGYSPEGPQGRDITFVENYHIIWVSGTHKGWFGLAVAGPDEKARVKKGADGLRVWGLRWAVPMTREAIEGVRTEPWGS